MKNILRPIPILMIAFVITMTMLAQKQLEEKKELEVQKETVDESSVLYSDIESDSELYEKNNEQQEEPRQPKYNAKDLSSDKHNYKEIED